jgi:tetraacyldisaccharide 4'-kinase
MREPSFWWRDPGPAAGVLAPVAALYGVVAAHRMAQPGRRVGAPVVCVGNLTVGGAGKTPAAIALARLLQAEGARPVFLTRGYGGSLAGPVEVTAAHAASEVGDEPLLLARVARTIVARDRVAGALAALATGADIIVMDDGFQNPALAKTFSLVVVDGRRGVGNGKVFPAGPLRAPLERQIEHAQALLIVGEPGPAAQPALAAARERGCTVLSGRLVPDAQAVARLKGGPALAFAGIADPEKFFATLRGAGIAVAATQVFPDHHYLSAAEADDLVARAQHADLALVTTEKDLARMHGDDATAALARRVSSLPVTLTFDDEKTLERLLNAIRSG